MYIVGLTGGIGAGKSTISILFSQKDLPIYNSDLSAKILMEQVVPLKKDIIKSFGRQVDRSGQLDMKYLSQRVFKDASALRRLNALVHPWVLSDFRSWMCHHKAPYCIKETAILFESGTHLMCDLVITITAPLGERIKRIMQRDQVSQAQVLERVKNQWTDQEKHSRSDIIIENIGDTKVLEETIERVHKQILRMLRRKALLL
ncbi:MAG: dephospho-CoA kinase [Flavobacteriales bacterium AspAUS03]